MKIVRGSGSEMSDDDVQEALRSHYLAPSSDDYWKNLEQRIVARLASAPASLQWWSHFPGWVRVGLVAAVAALMVAGFAAGQTRATMERMAVQQLLEASEDPVLSQALNDEPRSTRREETLRYLISR